MSDIIGTISAGRLTGSVGSTGNVSGVMSGGISRIGNSRDYNVLDNHPSIESVELVGDRKLSEFGLSIASNIDVISLFE